MTTIAIAAAIAATTAVIVYCMLSVPDEPPPQETLPESPETLRSIRAKYARYWPEEKTATPQYGNN